MLGHGGPALVPHPHGRVNAHPRAEHVLRCRGLGEHDLHGHALGDLDEIARRVVGGQEGEPGPRGARDRLNLAAEDDAREAVGLELDVLARLHVGQLGFLEVRDDPDFGLGRDREKRLARLDELAGFDVLP